VSGVFLLASPSLNMGLNLKFCAEPKALPPAGAYLRSRLFVLGISALGKAQDSISATLLSSSPGAKSSQGTRFTRLRVD
jgi:hypothetical protein